MDNFINTFFGYYIFKSNPEKYHVDITRNRKYIITQSIERVSVPFMDHYYSLSISLHRISIGNHQLEINKNHEIFEKYVRNGIYLFDDRYYIIVNIEYNTDSFIKYTFKEVQYKSSLGDLIKELIIQICNYLDVESVNNLIIADPEIKKYKNLNFSILAGKYPELDGLYVLKQENSKLEIECPPWDYVIKMFDRNPHILEKYNKRESIPDSFGSDQFNFVNFIFQYFTKIKYNSTYREIKIKLVLDWKALYNSCCLGILELYKQESILYDVRKHEDLLYTYKNSYLLYRMRDTFKFSNNIDKIIYLVNIPSYIKKCRVFIKSFTLNDLYDFTLSNFGSLYDRRIEIDQITDILMSK